MATGGLTKGKSHKEGGIPMKVKNTGQNIEVEGGEIIINKKSVSDTKKHSFDGQQLTKCEIASKINEADGHGVKIDCDSVEGKKYKYEKGGYVVFNYTDNIFASPHTYKTKKEAKEFIKEFRKRFEKQGYYKTNRWEEISPEHIDLEILDESFSPYETGGEIPYNPKQTEMRLVANKGAMIMGAMEVLKDKETRQDLMEMMRHAKDMQQMRQQYEDGGKISGNKVENLFPHLQLQALKEGEREIAKGTREEDLQLESVIENYKEIPKLYAQDGKGKNAVIYLHYFNPSSDWYITELDKKTNQGFGYVILNGDTEMSEFGYIPLEQLTSKMEGVNAFAQPQLDQFWSPKTLNQAFQSRYPELVEGEVEIYEKEKVEVAPITSDYLNMKFANAYERNLVIRELINTKRENPNNYTIEEKEFIGLYSGMGGLEKFGATDGLLYEYYTPKEIVEKMWGLAYKHLDTNMQIKEVLEPSVATGNFVGYAPDNVNILGYDIDKYAWAICKVLYPQENYEFILGSFEKQFINAKNKSVGAKVKPFYDLVIGNPPYGKYAGLYAGMGEQDYTGATDNIDYFIFRSLDLLKPKGLLVFIIGKLTQLGGKRWTEQMKTPNEAQRSIRNKADLIDAYRLPVGMFQTTDVESEIIVLRKK